MAWAVSRRNMGCMLSGAGDLSGFNFSSAFKTCSSVKVTDCSPQLLDGTVQLKSCSSVYIVLKYLLRTDAASLSLMVKLPSCRLICYTLLLTVLVLRM